MHLNDFARQLEQRAEDRGLIYELWPAATEEEIAAAQRRLVVSFHEQIVRLYAFSNGFEIAEPHFRVNALDDLVPIGVHLIHVATVDHMHRFAFDTSELNEAGQWFIVNVETGYRVSFTMVSIWSSKVWAWVDWQRPVWREETVDGQPWSDG